MWRLVVQGLMELLWPSRTQCLTCTGQLGDSGLLLCTSCLDATAFAADEPRCANCMRPTGALIRLCADCEDGSPFGVVFALGPHRDVLREAIHHLKFNDRPELATQLGERLAARIGVQFDCIVPVPLHRSRLRERGYNQAELVADTIARVLCVPIYRTSLARVRDTGHQAKLDREDRLHNLADAFALAECQAPWAGKRVLLVDDVLTTGATAAAAAAVLAAGGARSVDLAVLGVSTTPVRGKLKTCH